MSAAGLGHQQRRAVLVSSRPRTALQVVRQLDCERNDATRGRELGRSGLDRQGNEKVTMGRLTLAMRLRHRPIWVRSPPWTRQYSVRILPKAWEIVPNLFRLPPEDNALISFLGGVTGRGSTTPATGDAAAGFLCR